VSTFGAHQHRRLCAGVICGVWSCGCFSSSRGTSSTP
jgi:hypothetical protein